VGILRAVKPGDPNGDPPHVTLNTVWSDFTPAEPREACRFTADIPGAPEARTMVREVSIDPIVLPPDPNAAQGRARFVIASPNGLNPDLVKWAQVGDRRTIQVTIFDESGGWVRTFGMDVEGPVTYILDDPRPEVPYATLEARVTGGSLLAKGVNLFTPPPPPPPGGGDPGAPMPLVGFAVTIEDLQGGTETAFFKSVSGLKTDSEVVDFQEGGIHGSTRKLQGVTKWPNLVLVGPPKPLGKLFTEWVNLAGQGRPQPRTVSIAPLYLLDGKAYPHRPLVLSDVAPDRYEFPRLSGVWSDGELLEKISLPPSLGAVK
jgi:hypothetical protein